MTAPFFDIVIPTIGRPSLNELLASLARSAGPPPGRIFVVDDRRQPATPLDVSAAGPLEKRVRVIAGKAAGPASARNLGWRASRSEWVAFLDDDVVVPDEWLRELGRDISVKDPSVAGVQGEIVVPLPEDRPPTDWERNVSGLEDAQWATADMAYRRDILIELEGFDERFPRAYREDADLGLRIVRAGYRITTGNRFVTHPVRPVDRWVSVRLQRGNADDTLISGLHGNSWREDAGAPAGRFREHAVTAGFGVVALLGLFTKRYRTASLFGLLWLLTTGRFAWHRIEPGPRTPDEVSTMVITSAVIPPVAVWFRLRGLWCRLRSPAADRTKEQSPVVAVRPKDSELSPKVPL